MALKSCLSSCLRVQKRAERYTRQQRRSIMAKYRERFILVCCFCLIITFLISLGCATTISKSKGVQKEKGLVTYRKEQGPTPIYYDFEDVLIPGELKLDKKRSFVFHTPNFTAGVLILSGNVETNSLIKFFDNNMAKDNWQLIGEFKSPRTVMFFNKQNRSCIIKITEKPFNSEVEIWVAPTIENMEGGLLK